jgi:hypothetical protein
MVQTAQGKTQDPIQNNNLKQKGLVEWFKVERLSSNTSTTKKKKWGGLNLEPLHQPNFL